MVKFHSYSTRLAQLHNPFWGGGEGHASGFDQKTSFVGCNFTRWWIIHYLFFSFMIILISLQCLFTDLCMC